MKKDFTAEDLSNMSLVNLDLEESLFYHAILVNTNFEGANLKNSTFVGAYIRNANFKDAILEGANFDYCYTDENIPV
jgi:uncharacterized protein YjbI with pentapeptide repeats